MAARRMTKLLRVGLGSMALASVPLAYNSFKVQATSPCIDCNCPPASCQCPPRVVKITCLPIYRHPEQNVQIVEQPEEISAFRCVISEVRQSVWKYLDTVQGTTDKIKDTFNIGKSHTEGPCDCGSCSVCSQTRSMIDFLQNDPGALPRAAVITVAGLGGIVAGYKGGVLRKLFYSATAITAATSLCYPKEAVTLATGTYSSAYVYVNDLWHGKEATRYRRIVAPSQPWIGGGNQNQNASEDQNANATSDQSPASSPNQNQTDDDPLKVKLRDQSKPEDRDMYTTRSK